MSLMAYLACMMGANKKNLICKKCDKEVTINQCDVKPTQLPVWSLGNVDCAEQDSTKYSINKKHLLSDESHKYIFDLLKKVKVGKK